MKVVLGLLLGALLVGCNSDQTVSSTDPGTSSSPKTETSSTETSTPSDSTSSETPASTPANNDDPSKRMPKNGEEVAVMETNMGRIVLMFFPDKAPNHVENFKKLAKKGFYDGTKFHRVIPGFMIQGGDPNSKNDDRSDDGMGDPGYKIKAEFNDVHHSKGILSMARSNDPDSAGSQFFIMVAEAPFLDNQYTAFGRAVEGMDVADKIVALKTDPQTNNPLPENPAIVKSVKIVKWPVK